MVKISKEMKEITDILQASIESGAALAGTLQTENIGIEKKS